MTSIDRIRVNSLSQEHYDSLVRYIKDTGTLKGGKMPLFKIKKVGSVSGNPPYYHRVTIGVNYIWNVGDFDENREEIQEKLSGLLHLIDGVEEE